MRSVVRIERQGKRNDVRPSARAASYDSDFAVLYVRVVYIIGRYGTFPKYARCHTILNYYKE